MMRKFPGLYPVLALILFQQAAHARAIGEERFTLSAGGSISKFNSDLKVNGKDRGNNAEVDVEDDLGQDEDVDFYALKAIWRFADRHRLSLEYSPFSRDSRTQLENEFEFEDTVISSGSAISTDSDFAIYDVNYIYSFYKSSDMEIGVSGGIYWIGLDFDVQASGFIEDENGDIAFDDNYSNSVSTDAPLPLLGFYFDYQLSQRWELHSGARYFSAEIDDYDGYILSLLVGVEYSVLDNVSLGLSVSRFELDVKANEDSFNGEFGWEYSGAQLYLKALF